MSLVLSLCATIISLNTVCIIKPNILYLIYLEQVLYSSSNSRHTYIHTYTSFLCIWENHIMHLLYQACLYIKKQAPNSTFLFEHGSIWTHWRPCGPSVGCHWGLMGIKSCKVPLPGISEVLTMRRQHAIQLLNIFLFCQSRGILTRAGPWGIKGWSQQDWGELLEGRGEGVHMVAKSGSLPPQTCLFFPFEIDVTGGGKVQGASQAVYNINVHQEKERAGQWHKDNLNSEKERDKIMIISLYSFNS